VNYTFRQLPSASGAGFRFSFKAPQRLTHILRLRNCSGEIGEPGRALSPVSDVERMGVVLFQLPPNFRIDVPCLDSFLSETGSYSLRMAFEFRHASWFCDEVYDVLRNRGVALCVAESDELETPDIMTAPFACYRFRRADAPHPNLIRLRIFCGDGLLRARSSPTSNMRRSRRARCAQPRYCKDSSVLKSTRQ
jgi:uncharacterized protein YecE (DUF72 family)